MQICTSYFIFTITLKPQLIQILKHKQLEYRFRSLHVRAADKNVYLLITRPEIIACYVRGLIRNQRIKYIGIIDLKNPRAYSHQEVQKQLPPFINNQMKNQYW